MGTSTPHPVPLPAPTTPPITTTASLVTISSAPPTEMSSLSTSTTSFSNLHRLAPTTQYLYSMVQVRLPACSVSGAVATTQASSPARVATCSFASKPIPQ